MEENYTKRVLENLLNSSNSIITRYDLSLKLGAISLLLDFQNVEKHIEEKIADFESLSLYDEIFDVDFSTYANQFETISFYKELNSDTDSNVVQPGHIIDLLFPGTLIDDNRDKASSIREFLNFISSELSIEDITKALSEIKSILVKELRELNELKNKDWDDNYYNRMTENLFESHKIVGQDGFCMEPIHDKYLNWKKSPLYNPEALEMRLWKELYDLLVSGFVIVNDEYYIISLANELYAQAHFDLVQNKTIPEEELKKRYFFLCKLISLYDGVFRIKEKAKVGRYLMANRKVINDDLFMKFFGFVNVQNMIKHDMEISKPTYQDINSSLPENYLEADKNVFTDTMTLPNGSVVNTRSQVKKVADKINLNTPHSIGLFKLICDEAGALKGGINDMDYVRALVVIKAIPIKTKNQIKNICGSFQKKTHGHTRNGKTIPPIDKDHRKWKGADKEFGEDAYLKLLEIKK